MRVKRCVYDFFVQRSKFSFYMTFNEITTLFDNSMYRLYRVLPPAANLEGPLKKLATRSRERRLSNPNNNSGISIIIKISINSLMF